MTTVSINGPGVLTGATKQLQGITFYQWAWYVTVDGQVGIFTDWVDTNDPDKEPGLEDWVIDQLQADPGQLQGIAENDPGNSGDPGDYQGEYGGDGALAGDYGGDYGGDYDGDFGGDDGGGDGALAGGGDGFGDSA